MVQRALTLAYPLAMIAAVVFAPSTGIGQANTQEWVEIGSSRDSVQFIDLGSIRQRQNKPTGWILTYLSKPDIVHGQLVGYTVALYQADCEEDSIGQKSGTDYARSGEAIFSYDLGFEALKPVVPGSNGESMLNAICRRDRNFIGPTEAQVTQRLNLNKLRNADGTALLPDGEWAMSSDGQFYQVVNKIWTAAPRPNPSTAAVAPPTGSKGFDKELRLIELTSNGWVYDDGARRPVSSSEIELRGIAWIDVGEVRRRFLKRDGRYFNEIPPIEDGFEEGDTERFGEFVGEFNGSRFVPISAFKGISSALEDAMRTMPPVNRPLASRPASKQKKR